MSTMQTSLNSQASAVVVEQFVRATPQRVWKALTDAREMEKWLFSEVKTDPRAEGSYKMHWRSATDPTKDHERFGRYLEFVPEEKLVFEWHGNMEGKNNLAAAPDTVVTITLKAENGGTRVKLVHDRWPDTDAATKQRDGHNQGWTFYMDQLAGFFSDAYEDRRPGIGQKVASGN